MMALVPSKNANKEEIRDGKTMRTNQSDTFSVNSDETLYEQIYQFHEYRNGSAAMSRTNSVQPRPMEGMPIIAIGGSLNNRHRQSVQENYDIQLPLIESNRSRPASRNSALRITSESLDVLPLKRRRNPINYPMTLTSEDAKRSLRNLADHGTRILIEPPPPPKTPNSLIRIKTLSKEEPRTPPPEPPKSVPNRTQKGVLSRPFPTPELDCDRNLTYRLIIQNGITKDQTENFLQFRQFYYSIWGNVVKIFRMLEKLMLNYFVPIALINGEGVAELAQGTEIEYKPTLEELLSTIINRDEVEKLIKQPGRRFFGNHGKERAAIVIQSYWRAFRIRRVYQSLKQRKWAAHVIASCWLRYSKLPKIRKQLELTRRRQLNLFHEKQNQLRDKWTEISSNRRIVIHIPSLGFTERLRNKLPNLSIRENYQIGCLCELEDPNIDVIYVSPMPVNEEILQYYTKLINLRALVEQGHEQAILPSNINERFRIIVPEALNRFPGHNMCLVTLLKYSPKALKQIKGLIANRQAYLITGVSHIDDLHISEYLDIPLYGCEPEVSYLYSTKSGSKRIFISSNVPLPFGKYDIYNEKDLFEALTQLILDHIEIQRWIFKIDDHFDGLGIAFCDLARYLPCYSHILQHIENKSLTNEFHAEILAELPSVLEKYTIYVNTGQFNSWQSYLKVFLANGGIIEAYPPADAVRTTTICLSIEPNGRHSLICSGDQIHAETEFSSWGLVVPQSSTDPNQLNVFCSYIVEQCKQRNIYGHIEVDFLIFVDSKTEKENIWVSDLSIGYSEHVSYYRVMRYVTTGEFNPQTHLFTVKSRHLKQRLRNWQNGAPSYTVTEKTRYAIWSSKLYHKTLSNLHYSLFFQICRSHGIGFDIREKQGTIFTLLEADQHEHLGMITISETLQTTLANFICYLNAIHQEMTTITTNKPEENNFLSAVHEIENLLRCTQDNSSLNTSTS